MSQALTLLPRSGRANATSKKRPSSGLSWDYQVGAGDVGAPRVAAVLSRIPPRLRRGHVRRPSLRFVTFFKMSGDTPGPTGRVAAWPLPALRHPLVPRLGVGSAPDTRPLGWFPPSPSKLGASSAPARRWRCCPWNAATPSRPPLGPLFQLGQDPQGARRKGFGLWGPQESELLRGQRVRVPHPTARAGVSTGLGAAGPFSRRGLGLPRWGSFLPLVSELLCSEGARVRARGGGAVTSLARVPHSAPAPQAPRPLVRIMSKTSS